MLDAATTRGACAVVAAGGTGLLAREVQLHGRACAFAACAALVALVLSTASSAELAASAALPWILVALERLRTAPHARAIALVAGTSAAAVAAFAAGSSAAFAIGSACAVWVVSAPAAGAGARARSGAALAGGLVIGLVARDRAHVASADALHSDAGVDFVALGVVLACTALVLRWRALERSPESHEPRARILGSAGLVCALGAAFWILAQRGDAGGLAQVFVPARESAHASPFLASAIAVLALAGWLDPCASAGPARAAPWLALVFAALAWRVPGVSGLARALPAGLGVTPDAAAAFAAPFLALASAAALEHARTHARRSAAAVFGVCLALALLLAPAPAGPRVFPAADADDELVGWLARPQQRELAETPALVFWQSSALPAEPRLFLAGLDADGAELAAAHAELELDRVAPEDAASRGAPPGARVFRARTLAADPASRAVPGVRAWCVQLVLVGAGDRALGQRCAGAFLVPAPHHIAQLVASLLALLAAWLLPRARTYTTLAWLALVVAQAALALAA